jgi:hypothetical protein
MRPDLARALGLSFRAVTGMDLVPGHDPDTPGFDSVLWQAATPVVMHGTQPDPVFCYGNAAALALWEMEWAAFTRLPSRRSAAEDAATQGDRSAYLAEAAAKGWVAGYAGVRRSASGRQFRIADTVLWTVGSIGQAARIGRVD